MLVSNLWFNYSTNLGVRVKEVKSLCRSSYKELKKNKKRKWARTLPWFWKKIQTMNDRGKYNRSG